MPLAYTPRIGRSGTYQSEKSFLLLFFKKEALASPIPTAPYSPINSARAAFSTLARNGLRSTLTSMLSSTEAP